MIQPEVGKPWGGQAPGVGTRARSGPLTPALRWTGAPPSPSHKVLRAGANLSANLGRDVWEDCEEVRATMDLPYGSRRYCASRTPGSGGAGDRESPVGGGPRPGGAPLGKVQD